MSEEDLPLDERADGAPQEAVEAEPSPDKVGKRKTRRYEERIQELESEAEKQKAEAESWKNKYYEAYADLNNTRKSLEKDRLEMIKYRSLGFVEKMLPTLDNFEMAFKNISTDPKIKNYQTGFQMILKQLVAMLIDEGVSIVEPKVGDEFDHNTMSAMSTSPGEKDNLITEVFLKGYLLKDRLVRPAMVVVSKVADAGKVEEKTEE